MKPNMKMFDEGGNIKIDTSSCCSLTNYVIIKNYNETIDTVGVCLTNYDVLKERLTELYGSFKNNLDKYGKGTAQYISDAIKIYCGK